MAVGLIAIVILSLLGLAIRSAGANQKSSDTAAGALVAEQALERLAYAAENTGAGSFWSTSPGLYSDDQITLGASTFRIRITQAAVLDVDGQFAATGHRLRRLNATVEWTGPAQGKTGKGALRVLATRLVHEP